MNKVLLLIIFLFSISIHAQTKSIQYNHNVYLSAFGGSGLFAANYEYQFLKKEKNFLDVSLGIGFHNDTFGDFVDVLTHEDEQNTALFLPHHLAWNQQIFSDNHFIEIGFGGSFYSNKYVNHYLVYPLIHYRYIPQGKRFNLKIGLEIPLNEKDIQENYNPYEIFPVSCGLGYRF